MEPCFIPFSYRRIWYKKKEEIGKDFFINGTYGFKTSETICTGHDSFGYLVLTALILLVIFILMQSDGDSLKRVHYIPTHFGMADKVRLGNSGGTVNPIWADTNTSPL